MLRFLSNRQRLVLGVLGFACVATALTHAATDETALTIYSSAAPGAVPAAFYRPLPGAGTPMATEVPGYAMVRTDRDLQLQSGRSTLKYTDIAALLDPTTVTFASLNEPATRVLEQNFQFDLVSIDKLLQKYVDRPIAVERKSENNTVTLNGTLLSSVDGLVLKSDDGNLHALRDYSSVRFSELPGGLNVKPTLVWDITTPRSGAQRTRVTYQTGGMTWWADYNLVFNEGNDANSGLLDLTAWVSVINLSGASYTDAKLKLIAGDVHRVETPAQVKMMRNAVAEVAMLAEDGAGFSQKEFFEFHLYTLGRRTSLPNNSTKQIELFDNVKQIPARRILLYYGAAVPYAPGNLMTERNLGISTNKKVDVYLEFKNDKQYGLGVPLPAGRVRVSKVDADDASLEFIGEDTLDHTPKDETVRLKLGSSFDVVGERRQTDFAIDQKARWMEEEFEIKLRNHKSQAVEVLVKETLYRWSGWRVLSKTHEFNKEDAQTIHFPVKITKDGEAVIKYRVRYNW